MTAMNATAIGKAVGKVALGAAAAFGVIKGGRALSAVVEQSAQPAISVPVAATSADIAALREHFDQRFDAQALRLGKVEQGLSNLEGYKEAQKQAAMEKALGRRE